jgi:hypothetical protein
MITTCRPTNHLCPRIPGEKRSYASRGKLTGPFAESESRYVKFEVCMSCYANLSLNILGYIGLFSILLTKGGVG